MNKAVMTKAPNSVYQQNSHTTIFMAGSIEMGKADDWQTDLFNRTKDLPIHWLNPRRDDWDSSWKQDINNQQFKQQVEWELYHLEQFSEYQIFVFDKDTTSPITLMELGLMAGSPNKNIIAVLCPQGYFRKGNVDILCARYGIHVVESMDGLELWIRRIME